MPLNLHRNTMNSRHYKGHKNTRMFLGKKFSLLLFYFFLLSIKHGLPRLNYIPIFLNIKHGLPRLNYMYIFFNIKHGLPMLNYTSIFLI